MNNYCIYVHKNKINGKVYVGQTCQQPETRWQKGKGYKQCSYFYAAILKYGWDNFDHTILLTNLSKEEADLKEKEYISLYNSTDPNFGYNLQLGGNNRDFIAESTKEKLSISTKKRWEDEEWKEHFSKVMKDKWQEKEYRDKVLEGRKQSDWHISEEGKKRISEARKEYIKQHGTPTQGVGHTQEAKEKIRAAKLGEKNPMYGKTTSDKQKQIAKEVNSCPVQCIETQEIFSSRKEAALWCGLKSASSITECISGRKKSAGKHPITGIKLHWRNVPKVENI